MWRFLELITFWHLMTLTISLPMPCSQVHNRMSIRCGEGTDARTRSILNEERQRSALEKVFSIASRTTPERNGRVVLKRSPNSSQDSPQGKPRLRARAGMEDILTPEELEAFLDEESSAAGLEPPTMEEIKQFLTPEERTTFEGARRDLSRYQQARTSANKVLDLGGSLTPRERATLSELKESFATYARLRSRGIERLVGTGSARPEVVAWWNYRRDIKNSKSVQSYRSMTEEQRRALLDQKTAERRARNAAKSARIAELEARAGNHRLSPAEVRELAELQAERDRYNARRRQQYADMTAEQREAYLERKRVEGIERDAKKRLRHKELESRVREGRATEDEVREQAELRSKQDRANAKKRQRYAELPAEERRARKSKIDRARANEAAAKNVLETRIRENTATEEDRQEWARIQEASQQAKADRAAELARFKVIEGKVRDGTASEEESRDLENYHTKLEQQRRSSKKYYEKQKAAKKGRNDAAQVSDDRSQSIETTSGQNTTPPPDNPADNNQPSQFSVDSPYSDITTLGQSGLRNFLESTLQQAIPPVHGEGSARPFQPKDFFQNSWQALGTAANQVRAQFLGPVPVRGGNPIRTFPPRW